MNYDERLELQRVIGALLAQIEALGSTPAISDVALAADPPNWRTVYHPQRAVTYVRLVDSQNAK